MKLAQATELAAQFHQDKERVAGRINIVPRFQKLERFVASTLDKWFSKKTFTALMRQCGIFVFWYLGGELSNQLRLGGFIAQVVSQSAEEHKGEDFLGHNQPGFQIAEGWGHLPGRNGVDILLRRSLSGI